MQPSSQIEWRHARSSSIWPVRQLSPRRSRLRTSICDHTPLYVCGDHRDAQSRRTAARIRVFGGDIRPPRRASGSRRHDAKSSVAVRGSEGRRRGDRHCCCAGRTLAGGRAPAFFGVRSRAAKRVASRTDYRSGAVGHRYSNPRSYSDARLLLRYDVANAIRSACSHAAGEIAIFNVGTGIGTSVGQLAAITTEVMGSSAPIIELGADRGSSEIFRLIADPSHARLELGWQASIDVRTGIARMLEAAALA